MIVLEDMAHREPISVAEITLTHQKTEHVHAALTDAKGEARVQLAKGDYEIRIWHPDYDPYVRSEGLFKAGENELRIRLKATEGMVVEGEKFWKGVQRQVIEAEELRRIPGAFGDPVRALQSLPGVAKP